MKTRIISLGILPLLAVNALLVAGCNASSANPETSAAMGDSFSPLAYKAAPDVPQAPAQSIAPAAMENKLPASVEITPALADVVKLIQANVETELVVKFIRNSTGPFNIRAQQMDYLNNLGAPGEISLAMIQRDYAMNAQPAPPAVVVTQPVEVVEAAAPAETVVAEPPVVVVNEPAPVTVNYFYDTLSPYGSWVELDGYGRCWQPTVVRYQPDWRPYCDNGHWVNSGYGWYWVSDYSWGTTFHYGRWFNHPRRGWCWSPDTVWSPAWVSWRYSSDYCGWAPLPPRSGWSSGIGLTYYGSGVSVNFDFGLSADCYTFVPQQRFFDRRPYQYAVPRHEATTILNQTIVNNNVVRGDREGVVNRGFAPEHFAARSRDHRVGAETRTASVNPNRSAAPDFSRGQQGSEGPQHFNPARSANDNEGRHNFDRSQRTPAPVATAPVPTAPTGRDFSRHDIRNQFPARQNFSPGANVPGPTTPRVTPATITDRREEHRQQSERRNPVSPFPPATVMTPPRTVVRPSHTVVRPSPTVVAPPTAIPMAPVLTPPAPRPSQPSMSAVGIRRPGWDFQQPQERVRPQAPVGGVGFESRVQRAQPVAMPPQVAPQNFAPRRNEFRQPREQPSAPAPAPVRMQPVNAPVVTAPPANSSGNERGGRGDSSHGRRNGERDGDRR